ncbi:MAG: hypothetical protein AB1656_17490 [Candidatus Omnitrophota bacterium]
MKTAQEFIAEYQKLSLEEKQIVAYYVISNDNEDFPEENYSPEDAAKICKSVEEADQGINVSPELEGNEAIAYLQRLRRA